jgi:iron-only hydrogenase group A
MAVKRDFKKILEEEPQVKICQVAPSTRIGISECFDLKPGEISAKKLVTSIKKLGFSYVFDTLFSADVTILEEGTEFLLRLKNGELNDKPMFTSCCPGWLNLVEKSYPELLPYVSTTKSPQMIMGCIIKNIFAGTVGLDSDEIYSVSVMPCVRKQGEADTYINEDGTKDVDLVMTVIELADLFKQVGINPNDEIETDFDQPLGSSSGSAVLFGRSGGVMTAALRFAYEILTGNKLGTIELYPLEEFPDILESTITLVPEPNNSFGLPEEEISIKIAIIVGLGSAKKFIKAVLEGRMDHKFVEVMACTPYGCITGAGMKNVGKDKGLIEERKKAINALDETAEKKAAHENEDALELYDKYIGKPGGEKAHDLFHTDHESKNK